MFWGDVEIDIHGGEGMVHDGKEESETADDSESVVREQDRDEYRGLVHIFPFAQFRPWCGAHLGWVFSHQLNFFFFCKHLHQQT